MKSISLLFALSMIASTLPAKASPSSIPDSSFVQTPSVEIKRITWEEFVHDTLLLSEELKQQGPWSGIIAIARGGLVPAAILAQALNIKMIDTFCASSYDDASKSKNAEFIILKAEEKPGKWLIVDDLVDTGHTAKVAKELFPSAVLACVYAKPKGEPYADIYTKKIPQSTWVIFPWEQE